MTPAPGNASSTVSPAAPTLIVLAVFALGYAAMGMISSASTVSLIVIGLVLVVVCIQSTLIGILILLIAMLFSPEIAVGASIKVRAEDVVIPLLVLALIAKMCMPRYKIRLYRSPLDIPILIFMITQIAASFRGSTFEYVHPLMTLLWNIKIFEFFMIFWLTYQFIQSPSHVISYVRFAMVILIAVSIYAYFQIPSTEIYTTNRLTAPFEGKPEPTTLGGYFTLLLGMVAAFAIYEPNRQRKMMFVLLCIVVLIPLAFTLSRTSYVACGAMMFALGIVTRRRSLIIGTLLFLLLSPLLLPNQVIERIVSTFDETRAYGIDPSLLERIGIWRKVGHSLSRHFFLGHGVAAFQILDSQYARTLIESGILGFAAQMWLFSRAFKMGKRVHARATTPYEKAISTGYIVGILALAVHALAAVTFYITRIMEPFWFLTGVVASLDRYHSTLPEKAASET